MRKEDEVLPMRAGNVVAMPGVTLPTKESAVKDKPPENLLDNTIMKIDKLYTERDADVGVHDRTPVEDYADTATGKSLADLISEMDARHSDLTHPLDDTTAIPSIPEQIEADSAATVAVPETLQPIDPGTGEVAAADVERPRAHDALALLFEEFEAKVRGHIGERIEEATRALRREQQATLERVREIAALQVRKKETAMRAAYRAKYKEKEQVLRGHYKKLITLANQITKQKAQLQAARRQFEEKLRVANQLYREVDEMRTLLGAHLGTPEETGAKDIPRLKVPDR